jgi:D-tyrosyl-tRNA(Tyr) deacylase
MGFDPGVASLAADASGGNRPSFTAAAPPEQARTLYEQFVTLARDQHPEIGRAHV